MVDINEFKKKLFPLGFGTAQLDQDYGFDKRLTEEKQRELIKKIEESPINFIDTAPAYANAEKVLGKFLSKKKFIATKLSKIPEEIFSNKKLLKENIEKSIDESLKNLNIKKLDLLLLHQSEPELIFNKEFKDIINELKNKNKI